MVWGIIGGVVAIIVVVLILRAGLMYTVSDLDSSLNEVKEHLGLWLAQVNLTRQTIETLLVGFGIEPEEPTLAPLIEEMDGQIAGAELWKVTVEAELQGRLEAIREAADDEGKVKKGTPGYALVGELKEALKSAQAGSHELVQSLQEVSGRIEDAANALAAG